ncbi:MAG: MATE family efflux transporter [Rikenellaceae bacterium]|nr:MATE family efflux transporter [Rikenellaceae bacterium]MBO5873798.1 MATE family efflux transporter [Rikenellaceae bacterium]
MGVNDFTQGSEWRQILRFALPMMLGNLFMQLYQLVDTVIVGQFIGTEALAAVGASTPVVFMTTALVTGIGIGASVVISQYFGAKKIENIQKTSDTLFIFLLAIGLVVSVAGYFFSDDILRLMQLPQESLPQGTDYLQIYLGGSILLFGYNSVAAILRGLGDSKTPLYFLIIASVLNIILDLLFILVFDWGVKGAAWATVISQGISFILSILWVNRHNTLLRIDLFRLKFDSYIFGQCIRLGLPTGIQQVCVAVGMMALMGIVNQFGFKITASYTTAQRIDSLIALPVMNFAAALTSFVGQNMGAGNLTRIKRGLKATLLMTIITCLVINTFIIIFGENIMTLFTQDSSVVKIGAECLVVLNSFYIIFGIMFVLNGMLRGAGATIFPMLTTLVALWFIRVPSAAYLSAEFGYYGIWWSYPIGWTVGMLGSVIYYLSGRWKKSGIIKTVKQ